jgi:hypothetical protein
VSSGTDFKRETLNAEEIARLRVAAGMGVASSPGVTAGFSSPSATKHDQEKPMLAIMPIEALEAVGRVMTFGMKKYSADNWRKGFQYRRTLSAALRHIFSFLKGEDLDPETGESHLAHAACCVLFTLTFVIEKQTNLDDRYKGA